MMLYQCLLFYSKIKECNSWNKCTLKESMKVSTVTFRVTDA